MVLFSSLHTHHETVDTHDNCLQCAGHFETHHNHQHDCLFCNFLSLYYHGQPSEQPRFILPSAETALPLIAGNVNTHCAGVARLSETDSPAIIFFLPDTIFCLSLQSEDSPCRTRNCIKYNAIHHTTRSVSARQYGTNAKKSTLDHSTDTDTPGHRRDVGRTMLMHRTSVCRVPVGRRLLSHRQQLQDDSHNATVRLCAHCRNNPRPTPAAISGHDPPPCGQADATPPVAHTAGGPRPRAPRPLGRNDCYTEGLTLSSKRH